MGKTVCNSVESVRDLHGTLRNLISDAPPNQSRVDVFTASLRMQKLLKKRLITTNYFGLFKAAVIDCHFLGVTLAQHETRLDLVQSATNLCTPASTLSDKGWREFRDTTSGFGGPLKNAQVLMPGAIEIVDGVATYTDAVGTILSGIIEREPVEERGCPAGIRAMAQTVVDYVGIIR